MSNLAVLERESENPASFTWRIPGAPVQVRLAFSVVRDLQSQLNTPGRTSAEQGLLKQGLLEQGLLWGRAAGSVTEIHAFTTFPGAHRPTASDVESSMPPSGVSVPVGYYRFHHDAELSLNDEDMALAKAVFPAPYQVLLLIQPRESGPASATFFFWDDGRMLGDFPFLEFAFDYSLLTTAEKKRIQDRNENLPAQSPVAETTVAETPVSDPPPRRKRSLRMVVWGSLAAVVVIASLVMAVTGRFAARSRPPVVASPPPVLHPAPATASTSGTLGFRAERQNRDLRLIWNRDSAVIRNATSGELSILDTGGTRKILLKPAHIRTGTILYAPTADQVQLQLTIVSPQATASESLMVLLPQKGTPRVQPVARPVDTAPKAKSQPSLTQAPEPAREPPAPNHKTEPVVPGTSQAAVPLPPRAAPEPSSPLPQTTVTQDPVPASPERPPAQPAPPVYYPAVIASSVTPAYPPALKSMDIPTKVVRIKVSIDDSGRVVAVGPAPDQDGVPQAMITASLDAARLWKFSPARKNTQPIPSEMILRFEFKRPK
jgi:hypothetical protein